VDEENIVNGTETTEPESERPVQLQGKKQSTDDKKFYPLGRNDLHGRRQIFTDVKEINADNVVDVLNKALVIHNRNRSEMVYLEKYSRGIQPIMNRIKKYNDHVCNRTVVNLANEILSFKVADHAGEPIQYVSRGKSKGTPEKIETLNSLLLTEGKQPKDMDLAWQSFLYGVGYRLTLKDKAPAFAKAAEKGEEFDEAPFEIYIPDSRNTFVVKYNDVTKKPVMGVTYVFLDEVQNKTRYTVYTENAVFTIDGTAQRAEKPAKPKVHNFGLLPIVEYPCNASYMGCFEVVLDLLDAYNLCLSDRLDGIEQFIQALMVFDGVDIKREEFLELKDLGAIKIPPSPDGMSGSGKKLYYLNDQLDQSQTQTLVDNIKQTILEIVGMPSQGTANTSDSSNNGAMIIKNGWWHAESRALETEGYWKKAETEFLKIVLKICQEANAIEGLKVSDVEPKFSRHSYQDLLTKTQSFNTLMGTGVPPIQAYKYSGLDSDPEAASMQFEEYRAEQEAKEEEKVQKELDEERRRIANADKENASTIRDSGHDAEEPEQANPEED
jgi:SPP1 family phage portal protein